MLKPAGRLLYFLRFDYKTTSHFYATLLRYFRGGPATAKAAATTTTQKQ